MSSNTILVADDLYDRSTKGRRRSLLLRRIAGEMAQSLKCRVELLFVQELRAGLFKRPSMINLDASFEDLEKDIKEQFLKKNVKSLIHLKRGHPGALLHKWLNENAEARMLIMGTHGNRGLKKLFLGSIAEEVLRRSPLPVLVVGPEVQHLNKAHRFQKKTRILLMTDLNVSSARAEAMAQDLAKKMEASVTIFHTVGDHILKSRRVMSGANPLAMETEKIFETMVTEADEALQAKVSKWKAKGLRVQARLQSYPEFLEKSLEAELRKGYDLIIMGTHSRDAFLSAFLGSSARKTILVSSVPVLVVPEKSKGIL